MKMAHLTLTTVLFTLPALVAACGRDDDLETTGMQSPLEPHSRHPDPSSWDGTTMGDQERDHDLHRQRLLRRDPPPSAGHPTAPQGTSEGEGGEGNAPENTRDTGGTQHGTTGEFGGPPRGEGR